MMGLFGALLTGASALDAQSQNLSVISNNIANVDTIAYKGGNCEFLNFVTDDGIEGNYAAGGVTTQTVQTVSQQGTLEQTSSPTNIAITGNGFFPVVPNNSTVTSDTQQLYTRNGSFSEDASGQLVNEDGFVLQGWPISATGGLPASTSDVTSLQKVNVAAFATNNTPTSAVTLAANLNSSTLTTASAPQFTESVTVYDSLGTAQKLTLNFTKTAANTWSLAVNNGATVVSSTTLAFNSAGTLITPSSGSVAVSGITWGNGSSSQSINLNLSSLTQLAATSTVTSVTQDGTPLGTQNGIAIDANGYVIASYSNGATKELYQVPLVTFANPNALESESGSVYAQTPNSGTYNLTTSGNDGAGTITPSALETSNVDLADEFTKMIIAQRAYSAGAKVVTTSDQMLQDLLQIQ